MWKAMSSEKILQLGLLAMTAVTGLVDAVSFLSLGHVFTANMTGNVVLLGFAAFWAWAGLFCCSNILDFSFFPTTKIYMLLLFASTLCSICLVVFDHPQLSILALCRNFNPFDTIYCKDVYF